MKNIALIFCLLISIASSGAFATTYYVDDDAGCPGSGTVYSPYCSVNSCNSVLNAGDTCWVANGNYPAVIQPTHDGNAAGRITYLCAGEECTVTPTSAYLVNLTNRSHVTVDGFRFDGFGAMLVLSGPSSVGNLLTRVQASEATVMTKGGSGTILENFELEHSSTSANVVQVAFGTYQDQGTILRNGMIRGGGKNLMVNSCTDCSLDGLRLSGAWFHSLELNGATDLLIKNSVFMASSLDGLEGPFVKQAHNLTLLNNAFIRGWSLPTPGYGCGLTGLVFIRNNIFNNGGKRVDSTSANLNQTGNCAGTPNWPPAYDVDFNAYVGAGNFTDDFMTVGDDRAAFWRDYRNPLDIVSYYTDSTPSFEDWQDDLDCDQSSLIMDNLDYRPESSQSAEVGPLWGTTAPFWGAPVRCSVDAQSFETNLRWKDALAVGDRIEFNWDGTMREIVSVGPGSGNALNGCEYRYTFSPPLPSPAHVGGWFLAYPADAEQPEKRFVPQTDSPVIDAGDFEVCGHGTVNQRCDMGPIEYGAAGGDAAPPLTVGVRQDKRLVTWEPVNGALTYHVYRGMISNLADADGNGLPDAGYGSCRDSTDPFKDDTAYFDESVVPVGDGYFYVISYDGYGGEQGLGTTSAGQPRTMPPTAACP